MAGITLSKRKLTYQTPDMDKAKDDFAALGSAGKAYLETILISSGFSSDPYAAAFSEGRRDLAGELLGYLLPPQQESKVNRNLPDE